MLANPAYRFALPVIAAGACVLAALAAAGEFAPLARSSLGAVALGLVIVASEFLQLRLPRQSNDTRLSSSTLFAFAMLVLYGTGPALAWFCLAVALHDAGRRASPFKAAFNVAQYAIAMAAAGWVLGALSALPAGAGRPPFAAGDVPALVLAAFTLFAINHVLSNTVCSLACGAPLRSRYVGEDALMLLFDWLMVLFAPVVIVVVDVGSWLVPLLALPFVALLFSAREADRRHHDATHDAVTGLPNRSLFRRRIAEELERSRHHDAGVAVLLLDLDRFKEINDALGHDHGDRVLREVAARLRGIVRPGDVVARLGGDEFAILVPCVRSPAEVTELAERVHTRLADPVVLGELRVAAGASIGIGWGEAGEAEDVVRRADVAMYAAKDSRAGIAVYDAARDPHSPQRLQLVAELREGIPNGELVVHFQPKLSLDSGRVEGAEALVRWQHPCRGLLGPHEFVELAERADLMDALTLSVLRTSLEQACAWARAGTPLSVAVNVSAQTLLYRNLPGTVAGLLDDVGLPGSSLRLEITESSLMRDPDRSAEVLEALRDLGVRISIDDFGTGYSSLALLQRLPVAEMKVDRSFVKDMTENAHDAAIVRSTIDLGRNLGLTVVAEGVETPLALEQLRAFGCHEAQGYLISRPVPADELTAWLAAQAQPERVAA